MAGLVSKEDLIRSFHKREGDFFHRLVHDLAQDPTIMRWVIAFWLWLESAGHHNFVRRAYAMPGPVVLRLVEEAVACLRCLAGGRQDGGDSSITSLPCTKAFLAEPIDDVGYFADRRENVLKGVTYMYKTISLIVCVGNAATHVPPGNTSGARAAAPAQISSPYDSAATLMMSSPGRSTPLMISSPDRSVPLPMHSPGCNVPMILNSPEEHAELLMMASPGLTAPQMVRPPARGAPLMMSMPWCAATPMPLPTLNPMASPWVPMLEQSTLPEDYRSLFITFSKGYPVHRDDILEFFNSVFGPCVESVMVEKVQPGEVPVYGRVVMRSAAMIPVVLGGQQTARFMIKGKHLWARVYVPSSKLIRSA